MKIPPRLAAPLLGSIATLLPASGAEVQKANNTSALNTAASWTGGVVPGAADVALWNSTVSIPNNSPLGGDLAWLGIRIADVSGTRNQASANNVTISNASSANTLTLGSAGIDMGAATQALVIQSRVLLAANQTWNVANANTNNSPAALNVGEDLTFFAQAAAVPFNLGGFTVTKTGAGVAAFSSGYTVTNGAFLVNGGILHFQSGSSRVTTIDSSVSFTVNSGGTLAFAVQSANINVNAPITLNTGATLTLIPSQANTMTLGNTAAITVAGNATLNFAPQLNNGQNANAVVRINGSLIGAGNLTYNNSLSTVANSLRLNGDNSGYTGTFTMAAGAGARTLLLESASAGSAAATWVIATGNTLQVNGVSVQLGTLQGAGTITNTSTANPATLNVRAGDFAGAITDGGLPTALTKLGNGTLALTGLNTYSGATTVSAGALFAAPGSLSGATPVTLAAGGTFGARLAAAGTTLSVGTLTSSGTIAVDAGALGNPTLAPLTVGTLTVAAPSQVRVIGSALTTGTFPVLDYTGTLGGLGLAGLTLVLPPRVLGTMMDDGNTQLVVTITGFDTPKWKGSVDGKWDIDDGTGTGTANWVEINSGNATRYLQSANGADSVRFDDTATGSTTIDLTATLAPAGLVVENTALTYTFGGAGRLTGATGLIKNGAGTLRIRNLGANDFTGAVAINAGTLEIGDGATAGAGSLGTPTITNNGTLIFNRPDAFTIPATLSGPGTLVQNGAGTVTLGGAATPGGPIMLNLGSIRFSAGGNLSGPISGNGGIITSAGTLQLSGFDANTFTGLTSVTGGTLQLNKPGVLAVGGNITLSGNGVLQLLQPEQISDTATVTHTATVTSRMGNETIANLVVSPVTTGDAAQLIADNGLTITGTVTLTSGAYSTASNTTLSSAGGIVMSGGFLRIAANSGPSTLTVGSGGITASGGEIQVGQGVGLFDAVLNLGGDYTATADMSINRGGLLTGAKREINLGAVARTFTIAANTTTFLRPDLAGDGGLIKLGNGVLDLLGTPAYLGSTVVGAGTLRTSTAQTGTSSVSVSDGATFHLRVGAPGQSFTTPAFQLGTTTGANLAFDLGTQGNPILAPLTATAFSNSAGSKIAVVGTIAPGVFPLIDYTDPLGGAGFGGLSLVLPLRVAGSLQHDVPGTLINVQILGTDTPKWRGDLSSAWDIDDGTGTGTANWRGSFSGDPTRYLQGAGGIDAVVFDDTAVNGGTTVNLTTTLTPQSVTVANAAQNYTFTGPGKLSGATGLSKAGGGVLTIANTTPNDYTGPTTIENGALQIGNGITPGAGSVGPAAITNNGALVLNRPDDFTLPNTITNAGVLIKAAPATATLSAAANFSGPVQLQGGTLLFANGGTLGGQLSGPGALVAAGGTLQINGFVPNTNTGLTTVRAGTLQLNALGGNAVGGDVLIAETGVLAMLASEQIPDTATITFTGTSADSTAGSTGTETVANVVVNPSVNTGQFIMRNGFTILDTGLLQNGILGVASGHTATAHRVVMSAGLLRIAGSGGPSTLNVGPGGILASGGAIEVKFNTNNQDAILNLAGDYTATGPTAINNAGYTGLAQNVINLIGNRTFTIADGITVPVQPDFGGTGGLIKAGNGTLNLTTLVNAAHTGGTTLTAGTLHVQGAISGAPVTAAGGFLTGTGTLAGAVVKAGAQLAPGTVASSGTLTFSALLDVAEATAPPASGALLFDLGDPFLSDRVAFTAGSLHIGTGLEFDDFVFNPIPGFADQLLYTLFDGIAPITGALGANRHGLIAGLPAQLFLGDNGNDLMLLIPEPGSAALLLAGGAWLGLRRRRA
jgi:autotransporter-associated beta strand protein